LSNIAVFSSSSSQSISMPLDEPLEPEFMGRVGVRPMDDGAGSFAGNGGTGMLPKEGGGGGAAAEGTTGG
jgi:hypothetical protein